MNLGGGHLIDRQLGSLVLPIQTASLAWYLLTWLRTRTGIRSTHELHVLDALVTTLPPLIIGAALWQVPPLMRPELMILLAAAHELMLRAVIVPSSARRTLTTGTGLCIPIVVATHFYYTEHAAPGLPLTSLYTLAAGAWSAASVVVSTITSYTIFGLRQKVVAGHGGERSKAPHARAARQTPAGSG